jgi:hypothetical protein
MWGIRTRGRVCRLQLLLALARAVIFGYEAHLSYCLSPVYCLAYNILERTIKTYTYSIVECVRVYRAVA